MLREFDADSEVRRLNFEPELDPEEDKDLIMCFWFPIVHLVDIIPKGWKSGPHFKKAGI